MEPSMFSSDLNTNQKIITVIGSIGYDQKIYLDEMPETGETKFGNIEIGLGGKGNIEAVACSRMGEETIFIGAVGDKDYDSLQKHFKENNVDSKLKKVKNIPSHTACILIDKDGNHRIISDPRASFLVDKNLIIDNKESIEKSGYILLQLEISFQTVEYVIEEYKNKKTIILRPSPPNEIENLKKLFKNVDYLILNEKELGAISGDETKTPEQIELACEKIMKLKPKNLIVPLLDKGWLLYNEKGKKKFATYSVGEPIDKVGSMDCFIGVFAAFLCKNYELDEAIKYAILASSICSTKEGTIPSLPYVNEMMRRRNKIKNW